MGKQMEFKQFPATVTGVDEDKGIVDLMFSVFGVLDEGNDVVHPGAFAKTFTERGRKVRIVDMHQADSVLRVLGKPLALKETPRDELPDSVKAQYPEATGGASASVQFNLKTQNGHDAFQHVKAGDITEWSFGYDAINPDFSNMKNDAGQDVSVRNLREIKLYEISPVLWGMNPATATVGVKAAGDAKVEPSEGESEDDFIARCVPAMVDEGREQDQAVAMCYEMYRSGKGDVDTPDKAGESLVEAKTNLSRLVSRIQTAFSQQFNPTNGPYRYWTRDVHDSYVVVDDEGPEGTQTYQVSYTVTDDEVQFAPRAEWVEGALQFIPGATDKSTKVGRVLAGRNVERARRIMKELRDLFEDAGVGFDDILQPQAQAPEILGEGMSDNREHGQKAGPADASVASEPPTSDDVALEIEVLKAKLSL